MKHLENKTRSVSNTYVGDSVWTFFVIHTLPFAIYLVVEIPHFFQKKLSTPKRKFMLNRFDFLILVDIFDKIND